MKLDFNLYDLFQIFDSRGKGYVKEHEFVAGLSKCDVVPEKDE
jgi:hypothetical protein